MKCEQCGLQEATYHMKSNVNGHITEQHLCQECARKLGLTERFRPMFQRRSFFSPFSLLDPFLNGMGSHLLEEFPEPETPVRVQDCETESVKEPEPMKDNPYVAQRRRNALQAQLDAAIAREDFEEACKLRDEIKSLTSKE